MSKKLDKCFTAFRAHAWQEMPMYHAALSQDTKCDFKRRALQQRAVDEHLNERMRHCQSDRAMIDFLNYQRTCLAPYLDLSQSMISTQADANVHLGGLAPRAGEDEHSTMGSTHTVYVDGTPFTYTDQPLSEKRAMTNIHAIANIHAAGEMMKSLPGHTSLDQVQTHFTEMLQEASTDEDE